MRIDQDIETPGSFGRMAALLLSDLHIWARMCIAKEAEQLRDESSQWIKEPQLSVVAPVVIDEEEMKRNVESVTASVTTIQQRILRISEQVTSFHTQVTAIASQAQALDYNYGGVKEDGEAHWTCEEISVLRRACEQELIAVSMEFASLQVTTRAVFTGFWLRHLCPPHPCDDPPYVGDARPRPSGAGEKQSEAGRRSRA